MKRVKEGEARQKGEKEKKKKLPTSLSLFFGQLLL
jgi:hypothetical protein